MNKIAVIGAGTMGNGIAHVFAQHGFSVNLIDSQAHQLEKALATISTNLDRQIKKGLLNAEEKTLLIQRIQPVQSISQGLREAELIIEAATENEKIKRQIFEEMDQFCFFLTAEQALFQLAFEVYSNRRHGFFELTGLQINQAD